MVEYRQPPYDQWETAQPYALWAEARADDPVQVVPASASDPGRSVHVLDWELADRVLRDPRTFSSSVNNEVIGAFMGDLILGMDGDEHRRYRNLVAHAFRRSSLERWRRELIAPTIHRLLDAIAAAGRADLVTDVTARYPVQVICAIVGVPVDDHEQFHQWAEEINNGPLDPSRGMAAAGAMRAYLEPLVAARRRQPVGDLLSELVHAEIDGERLSDERLYGFLRLLLPAGAETTFRAMGSTLLALLSHPDVYERVLADRHLLPAVIEETLRWESSVTMVSRVSTTDTELGGTAVPAGCPVTVLNGAANRDPTRWVEPDQWDPDRPATPHLAFGTGSHQCLGMHLARLELEVGVGCILDRLPGLRLDPAAEPPRVAGYAFRGPATLPVVFDPRPVG